MKTISLLLLFVLVAILGAQTMIVTTVADITGDGAAHALKANYTAARWVQIVAPAANTAAVRFGDSNTSASRGIPIAAGGSMYLGESQKSSPYDLATLYYYAANNDKLTLTYGNYKTTGDQ